MRSVDTLVIHHSATPSGTVARFREEHRARGFDDIGYHDVIGNGKGIADGVIERGRPYERQGAGVFGNNKGKLHVCLVGNFHKPDSGYTGSPTERQYRSLGSWLLTRSMQFGPRVGKAYPHVVGHKEITVPGHATACPGSDFPLDEVRIWLKTMLPLYVKDGKVPEGLDRFLGAHDRPEVFTLVHDVRCELHLEDPERKVFPTALLVNNKSYIRVTDLIKACGWGASFDKSSRTIHIKTKK